MNRMFAALLAAISLSFTLARNADAQDAGVCPAPLAGWVESFPANGAANVPTNAPVHVRYTPGFLADREATLSVLNAETGQSVPGTLEQVGDELFLNPSAPLDGGTRYDVTASGGVEGPLSFSFTTSLRAPDTDAPSFPGGLGAVSFATEANTAPCEPEFPYRVGVQFRPVANEASAVDVEYLLYVVRGEGVSAPVLRARARTGSPDIVVMSFGLDNREAHAPLCFSILAVDGALNVSEATPATCFQPIDALAFAPACSAARVGLHAPLPHTMWGILLCISARLAQRNRRRLRSLHTVT